LGAICNFSTKYEKLYPTNVLGVERLTGLALKAGVKRFVHVTSTSVYGYYKGSPFQEVMERDPQDDYARSKRDGEDVVFRRMKEGLPAVIVRPCTVYGPRCNDGAGKAFSRPTSIAAIPGSGKQLLSNIRAEDVAACLEHLSELDAAVGQIYNIAEDSNPSLEVALTLAAKTYNGKAPMMRLPIGLVKAIAGIQGAVSKVKGGIPDLEYNAVRYLYADYVVDNKKLKSTGFNLKYPDFAESMKDLGRRFAQQDGATL
jgi:UDP-glucose 4-epimerase